MSSLGRKLRKRDEIIAIDLGFRITKAVHLRRIKGGAFHLCNYVLVDAPIYDKSPSVETLAEHLQQVCRSLGATTKHVSLAIGASSSLLCHAELPLASPADLRRMVKLSPKNYLQQDLPDHIFDCHTGPDRDGLAKGRKKLKVLVGGAKARLVETLQQAAAAAGFVLEQISLGQVGLVNAFRVLPEDSHGEVVALVDIGFNHTSISIVLKGELALTRVVHIGAERFSQAMTLTDGRETADAADLALTEAMQAKLQNLIVHLGKEIDASIGFFVNHNEVSVNQVYVSGGSARSQFIVQTLESELGLPCETWNPTKSLTLSLPARQMQEIDFDAAQLATAIGAGMACMVPDLIGINLLADEQEAIEMRRRDPVRRGYFVAATAVGAMLAWAGYLGWEIFQSNRALARHQVELQTLEKNSKESLAIARRAGDIERAVLALHRHATNRPLWAPTLSALQFATVPGIEFHRLRMDLTFSNQVVAASAASATGGGSTNRTTNILEKLVLTIQAKNYGEPQAVDQLIENISASPHLTNVLRAEQPVLLKDLQPRQIDPSNPDRTFVFFTTECVFRERTFKNE